MSSGNLSSRRTENCTVAAGDARLAVVVHRPGSRYTGCTVIFCHGFRGSKEGGGRATALAEKIADLGHFAVRFDFTPNKCLSQQVAELTAVVAFCRANVGGRIILFGRSMGGSAALAFAAADRRVAGICLWATPYDFAETVRLWLGDDYERLAGGESIDIEDEFGRLTLARSFIDDFDSHGLLACVRSLAGAPLLIVHGDEDETVPPAQAEEIYRQAGEPKELVAIRGGDHRFLRGHPEASAAVIDWLNRRFPRPGI